MTLGQQVCHIHYCSWPCHPAQLCHSSLVSQIDSIQVRGGKLILLIFHIEPAGQQTAAGWHQHRLTHSITDSWLGCPQSRLVHSKSKMRSYQCNGITCLSLCLYGIRAPMIDFMPPGFGCLGIRELMSVRSDPRTQSGCHQSSFAPGWGERVRGDKTMSGQ